MMGNCYNCCWYDNGICHKPHAEYLKKMAPEDSCTLWEKDGMNIRLRRLLTALHLKEGDLAAEELKSLTWLADSADWRCLNNLESIFVKAIDHSTGSDLGETKK